MNLDKADVKIDVATEIGARIEDVLEGARKDVLRQEGATSAFYQAAKACEDAALHVDKDMDEGKFGLEVAAHIKRYVDRCANATRNLAKQSEALHLIAMGKSTSFEMSVKLVEKFRTEEQAKVTALREALANGSLKPAPEGLVKQNGNGVHTNGLSSLGIRPGMTIKEQRLAEAAAAEAVAAPVAVVSAPAVKLAGRPRGRPRTKG
jgi:hypothetical protein